MSAPAGSATGVVGVIANPAAGKDIRRLVSAASPVSDMAKIGMIRRAVLGAVEGGARRLVLADDRHALARRAVEDRSVTDSGVGIEVLDLPLLSSSRDSVRAAETMAARRGDDTVGAVIVLGGDGTHRDVVKGWRSVTMVAMSTGTNNVFPRALEATTAGEAAGRVVSGRVAADAVGRRAKVLDVVTSAGRRDLALVEVSLTTSSFTASRAVWEAGTLRQLVAAIAEPATVGLSSLAAAVEPLDRGELGAVEVVIDDSGSIVRCPLAPGRYVEVPVASARRMGPDDVARLVGPGTLTFDGERDLVLTEDESAEVRIATDGPMVIDPTLALARPERLGQHRDDG